MVPIENKGRLHHADKLLERIAGNAGLQRVDVGRVNVGKVVQSGLEKGVALPNSFKSISRDQIGKDSGWLDLKMLSASAGVFKAETQPIECEYRDSDLIARISVCGSVDRQSSNAQSATEIL